MSVEITSNTFRLRALPEQGGKISELFAVSAGRNLLLPELPSAGLPLPDGATFSVSGWDECLPTVEASAGVPDLGYAWRTSPEMVDSGNVLHAHWNVPGWHLDRDIVLNDDGLTADYRIANQGSMPAPALWAAHVLLPLEGMHEAALPVGDLLPGPGCDVEDLAVRRLSRGRDGWFLRKIRRRGMSWKFFLPAHAPVQLRYEDVTLTLTTDAGWWGIWLNEGNFCDLLCLGVEPTNWPSDALADVETRINPGEPMTIRFTLSVS